MSAEPSRVISLKTARVLVEQNTETRSGPFEDSGVYDGAADVACWVLRKYLQIEGEGKFSAFVDSTAWTDLVLALKAYGLHEQAMEASK